MRTIVMTTTVAALLLGGLTSAHAQTGRAAGDAAETAAPLAATTALADAVRAAEAQVSGRAFEAAPDDDDADGKVSGAKGYAIHVQAGDAVSEVHVDATTGKVVRVEKEGLFSKIMRDDDEVAPALSSPTSLLQAIAAAEAHTGGHAMAADVDRDDGVSYYDVVVAAPTGAALIVKVSAETGAVAATRAGGGLDDD